MNKRIFIINGGAGVGKDTFCNMVGDVKSVKVISSVDQVKKAANFLGWNFEKTSETRKLLSDLKDLSTAYFDGPMRYLRSSVHRFNVDDRYEILFMHIREPEEIDRAAKEFHAETILITNCNVELITSNHADSNVEKFDYDYVIDNSGSLDDLRKAVGIFVKYLDEE